MKVGCIGAAQNVVSVVAENANDLTVLSLPSTTPVRGMQDNCDVLLLDLSVVSLDVVRYHAITDQLPVVVLMHSSSSPTEDDIREVFSAGAYDYAIASISGTELATKLKRAARFGELKREIACFKSQGNAQDWDPALISVEPCMRAVLDKVAKLSNSDATVLLSGELGTEKELIARTIHNASSRAASDFVAVDCGSQDLERSLFVMLAERATVYLRDVESMPLCLQQSLHGVLLRGVFTCRVLSGTSGDLAERVQQREFLPELYADIALAHLDIPPLRRRPDDIPLLARVFLDRLAQQRRWRAPRISLAAQQALKAYNWPTNVEGLRQVMSAALDACDGDEILVRHLGIEISSPGTFTQSQSASTGR
ncbi:MAG TPA: sigma 54-interacting transcriptional regulator [Terriglobales bacterium]|nr:sigma 54-interacting transcriptional regulator [Terriglobales bacterium]